MWGWVRDALQGEGCCRGSQQRLLAVGHARGDFWWAHTGRRVAGAGPKRFAGLTTASKRVDARPPPSSASLGVAGHAQFHDVQH